MQFSLDSLKGQVAIVTGGGSGMGRSMALGLLDAGASVVVADFNAQSLTDLKAARPGDRLHCIAIDLSRRDAGEEVVAFALKQCGRLDAVVNNAGLGRHSIKKDVFENPPKFWETSPEHWERFIGINTNAPFFLMRAAIPHLMAQRHGRIVNVTTSLDSMLRGGMSPYGPSKACTEALTSVAAHDLQGTGVTANVIVPGGTVDTSMVPAHAPVVREKLLRPEIMVPPLLWLLSDHGANTTNMRFRANLWDPSVPVAQALAASGQPVGWPAVAQGQMANTVTLKT